MTTLKKTAEGNSYWNENGAYQKEYDELYSKLVPSRGAGETVHAELIRGIGRLFYDYCNNGNCNTAEVVTEDCESCGGSGYEEDDDDGEVEGEEDCNECYGSGYVSEDCNNCGGECEVEVGVEINPYYKKFTDLIENEVGVEAISGVRGVIKSNLYSKYTFEGDEMAAYNKMCDMVIHHVLTTEDSELPSGYDTE
jgi:hypothetical protein